MEVPSIRFHQKSATSRAFVAKEGCACTYLLVGYLGAYSKSKHVQLQSKVVNDPVINEYINRVGQNTVRNSDSDQSFTIKVLDCDEVNASALPGGFFYVNSGLILAADDQAELAGVMAHGIGYGAECHAGRESTRQPMQILTVPLVVVGARAGHGAHETAVPLTFLHFSREFEVDAYTGWASSACTRAATILRRSLLSLRRCGAQGKKKKRYDFESATHIPRLQIASSTRKKKLQRFFLQNQNTKLERWSSEA